MFLLGLLGFFQMAMLPGALALRLLRFRGGFFQTVAYTFGLSLILNSLLVPALAGMGLYNRPVLLLLAAVELGALTWLFRQELGTPLGTALEALRTWLAGLPDRLPRPTADGGACCLVSRALRLALLLTAGALAVDSLLWLATVFRLNLGQVFETYDAVISWNSWAVGWSLGSAPAGTESYPQLLPANWSLTYVLMGEPLEFFAKALSPLFFFFILLMIFDLGLEEKSLGLLLAVTVTRLMMKKLIGEYMTDGYADFPVAMFALLSVYAVMKARRSTDTGSFSRNLWLGAVFAGGAAAVKQTGLFILALYPLLAWLLAAREREGLTRKEQARAVLLPFALGAALALPWYAHFESMGASAQSGMTQTIFRYMFQSDPGEKLARTSLRLGKYGWLIIFSAVTLPFMRKPYRWLAELAALPYSLAWFLFLSYDARNLALAMPLIGISAGAGFEGLAELGLGLLDRLRPGRLRLAWLALALLGLAAAAGALLFPDASLRTRQEALQRQLFNPALNEKLYDFASKADHPITILTNYPVRFLPGFNGAQVNITFRELDTFRSEVEKPGVEYILVPQNAFEAVLSDVDARLTSGEYELIFEDDHVIPYRFIHITRNNP